MKKKIILEIGDRVRSAEYGDGTVVAIHKEGDQALILFDKPHGRVNGAISPLHDGRLQRLKITRASLDPPDYQSIATNRYYWYAMDGQPYPPDKLSALQPIEDEKGE